MSVFKNWVVLRVGAEEVRLMKVGRVQLAKEGESEYVCVEGSNDRVREWGRSERDVYIDVYKVEIFFCWEVGVMVSMRVG